MLIVFAWVQVVLVLLLQECDGCIKIKNKDQKTPLHLAAENGRVE